MPSFPKRVLVIALMLLGTTVAASQHDATDRHETPLRRTEVAFTVNDQGRCVLWVNDRPVDLLSGSMAEQDCLLFLAQLTGVRPLTLKQRQPYYVKTNLRVTGECHHYANGSSSSCSWHIQSIHSAPVLLRGIYFFSQSIGFIDAFGERSWQDSRIGPK